MSDFEDWRPWWRKLEFAGVTAIAITLLFMIVGQSVEQVASNAFVDGAQAPKTAPKFNAVDYAATGSTGAQKIVIGPCDARKP